MYINQRRVILWKRGRLGQKQMTLRDFKENATEEEKSKILAGILQNAGGDPYLLKKLVDKYEKYYKKPKKKPKPRNWNKYSINQTTEKPRFLQLLSLLINSADIIEKPYIFGRPSISLKDIIKCCSIKVYTGLSCRKVIPELKDAFDIGIINHVPHYNLLNGYLRNKWMIPLITELIELSALPLSETNKHFAVDSSGFTNNMYRRYLSDRLGNENARIKDYLKVHLICSTESLIVPAVNVLEGTSADSPQFKVLVSKTAENFDVEEVYADKGYSSRDNYEVVKRLGGRAFIPFKSNATGKSGGSSEWRRAYLMWKDNPNDFDKSYHNRSVVESLFSSAKRTKLNFIRSKNFVAGRNEILLKVLCHNLVILANLKDC